jgi:hypothetical protein
MTGSAKAIDLQKNTSVATRPKWNDADKNRLSKAMSLICLLQKTYGKSPDQLGMLVEGFAWALSDFSVDEVLEALKKYVASKPDIPAPSDIIAILRPNSKEWTPDWAVYNRFKELRQSGGAFALSEDEVSYMRRCEAYSLGR